MRTLILLLLLLPSLFCLEMLTPEKRTIKSGDVVDLGKVGPGQTVALSIFPKAYEGGINNVGGYYDLAYPHDLPLGWKGENSSLYGNPLQVKITADPYAEEGVYYMNVSVIDWKDNNGIGEGLEDVTFSVRVEVVHDVLDAKVDKEIKKALVGQPARFYITVINKANTGDVFKIRSRNVVGWNFERTIYVPPNSQKTVYYEVIGNEEESYDAEIEVVSLSSPLIYKRMNVHIILEPTLLADYKATNNGLLLFPPMSGLLYFLAGLLSNFF